jgi:hypothetical protein
MNHRLSGCRVKIARARKHLEELDRTVNGFLSVHPYDIYSEFSVDTGEEVWRIKVLLSPPVELGGIIGDVVHNLRSALDLAVCRLVRVNNGNVTANTGFPVYTDATDYQSTGRKKVRGVTPAALRIIDFLQPCNQPVPPEDHMNYILHRLDITDKHRLLIPVGSAMHDGDIYIRNAVLDGVPQSLGVNPIVDGAEFLRVKHIIKKPNTEIEPRLRFELVFERDGPGQGQEVLHLLSQLVTYTEKNINWFDSLFV